MSYPQLSTRVTALVNAGGATGAKANAVTVGAGVGGFTSFRIPAFYRFPNCALEAADFKGRVKTNAQANTRRPTGQSKCRNARQKQRSCSCWSPSPDIGSHGRKQTQSGR